MKLAMSVLLFLWCVNASAQNYKTKVELKAPVVQQMYKNPVESTTSVGVATAEAYALGDIFIRVTTDAMRNEGTRPTTYSPYLHLDGTGFKRNNLVNVTCSCQINTGVWVDYPDQVFKTSEEGKLSHYFSTIDDKTLCRIRAVEPATKRVAVTGWKK
jgi:hypothetical protein